MGVVDDSVDDTVQRSASEDEPKSLDTLHFVPRGQMLGPDSDNSIHGFDYDRMQARALLTAEEEKKLLRRVDWHLMPLCALMFLLKNLDSINVSNIRIMNAHTERNILVELGMSANQYNFVATIYYIPYIIFEAPSNLFVKRFLPSRWLSRIMISWGAVLCCHAAVANGKGLYAARFFLGLMEAGMFPGVILQLCYWYRPDEMARRLLYFYMLGNCATVISGILAFAFDGLSGASKSLVGNGKYNELMFLIEGIATVIVGILLVFIHPDFPPQAKWLSEREKAFIQARLPKNAPNAKEANFKWREIIEALKDKRTWLFTLCWAFFTVGTTGLTFYQPTVIANLGFTSIARSQLLNIPSAVLTIAVIGIFGIWADTARLPRPLYPLGFMIVILAMYGVIYRFPSNGAVYAATIIAGALGSGWYPLMWPWRVQTTAKATGSAFAIGFVNSYGQIGGALGPLIFQSKYAPRYGVSFGIAMGILGVAIVVNLITWKVTGKIEKETRMLKLARVAAAKRNEAILDDVDIGKQGELRKDVEQ